MCGARVMAEELGETSADATKTEPKYSNDYRSTIRGFNNPRVR